MFKKSMIALAVMAMATGIQAKTVTGNATNSFNDINDDYIVEDGYIGLSGIKINAQNIIVSNPKAGTTSDIKKHGIYAQGSVELTAAKDITITSNYLGIYLAGHESHQPNPAAQLTLNAKNGTVQVNAVSG